MYSTKSLAVVVLLACSFAASGQPAAKDGPLNREALVKIQDAARDLSRQVEFLEEDLVSELSGAKERSLYSQVDALLANIEKFRKSLKADARRDDITQSFDRLDDEVHKLLTAIASAAKEVPALRRAATRVGWADDQLHHALFMQDGGENRQTQTLQRKSHAMADAAARLDRVAEYSLAATPGRAVLTANIKKLADSCKRFQKSVDNKMDRDALQKQFAEVTQAWQQVTQGMADLKTSEGAYLVQNASELDRLHESIFRILGGKGDRPRLIIRT